MDGVEEYNQDAAWARLKAGFSPAGSDNYNAPPELRFVEGGRPNFKKIMSTSLVTTGPVLDSWVTRYPGGKQK